MKKNFWFLLVPLTLLFIFFIFSSSIDLAFSRLCYTPSPEGKGHFIDNAFTQFFYSYGEWPAFILCDVSVLIFVLSFFLPILKKWRRCAFAITLTFFLGAGLLVNGILKEHIERPRPRQITEFGGGYTFRPVYKPVFVREQNKHDGQKSFPSGHVTTGAYFLVLILASRRMQNLFMRYIGIAVSLAWTICLMMTRIMQGGHFLSDTLTAVFLMWIVALFVDWLAWESRFCKTWLKNEIT